MAITFSWDLLAALIGFLLTLMILSYLIGDNPAFRLAIYLFIGVSAGYAAAVTWNQVLLPRLFRPLLTGGGNYLSLLIPLGLGVLLLTRLSVRFSSLSDLPLAMLLGVGAATAVGGALFGTLFPQTGAVLNAFDLDSADSAFGSWISVFAEAFLMLLGTVSTLLYFQFSARSTPSGPRRGKIVDFLGAIGQGFIAITFGVLFAGVLLSAMTALIERLNFIVTFISQFL